MVDWVKLALNTAGAVSSCCCCAHVPSCCIRPCRHTSVKSALCLRSLAALALIPACSPPTTVPHMQLGGVVGLALGLLYFLQEKIVSAAAEQDRGAGGLCMVA